MTATHISARRPAVQSPADLWEPAKRFVDLLKKVRECGDGSWTALCPAHTDKSRSLSVRIGDEAVVIRCFAGCEVEAIVSAVGLRMQDLYPPRPSRDGKRRFPPFPWRDFASHSRTALTAICIALRDIAAGKPITASDAAFLRRTAADLLSILDSIESAEARR